MRNRRLAIQAVLVAAMGLVAAFTPKRAEAAMLDQCGPYCAGDAMCMDYQQWCPSHCSARPIPVCDGGTSQCPGGFLFYCEFET